jgi:outer membrane protein OmpA-like peptidoglycan-associated protein
MRRLAFLAVPLLLALSIAPAQAQRPASIEAGLFGQFTKFDEELSLDDAISIGGRFGFFVLPNLAVELDGQFGKTDWLTATGTQSITYMPWAARAVYGIPLGDRLRFLVGLGYQQNVFRDRVQEGSGFVAGNEFEDALSGLVGLKVCVNEKWSIRGDVPIDYNPSPNFNGNLVELDGKSTNVGFRIGVSRMFKGTCHSVAPAPPPPPPAATPAPTPTPTPQPAPPANRPPTATITSPSSGASLSAPVNFAATCQDPEQGDVSASARWRSSRDGDIGTGGSFTRALTPGNHTITLTCSDQQGLAGTANVSITWQQLLLRLNDVYFDFNRATLTQAGRDTLDSVIATMRQQSDTRVAIEGHTDPFGTDSYNQSLSERRAQAVVSYVANAGIAPNRMQLKGFGEQCLLLDDDHTNPTRSRAEHRVNRRVEVWSVGDAGVAMSCRPRQ